MYYFIAADLFLYLYACNYVYVCACVSFLSTYVIYAQPLG